MSNSLNDSLHLGRTPPDPKGPHADRVHDWALLTSTEFGRIDPAHAVVTVTCSPVEVHGPHLPMGADCLEAESILRRTAGLLLERHPRLHVLRLPPLYVAADVVPQTGSLHFRPATVTQTLTDLGRSLARQGFGRLWVSSFHGGPRHFLAIEEAAHQVNRRWGGEMISVFSLMVARLTGGNTDAADFLADVAGLPVDVLRGDTHAGTVETALLLHLMSELVDPVFARLPRRTVSSKLTDQGRRPIADQGHPGLAELLRGFYYKLKYFEDETYAGDPQHATGEMGARLLDHLAGLCADSLDEVLHGQLSPDDCHSPVWPLKRLFLSERLGWLVETLAGHKNRAF